MSLRSAARRLLACCALVLVSLGASAAELTVSAASSLSNAFRELGALFEAQSPGARLLFNFGASDALLAQIARGAPVDVLACADQESMDRAESQKLLLPGTRRDFARNALVLIVPSDSALPLRTLGDLQRPEVRRIALGQPASVPAGRYARGVLEAARLWSVLEPRFVFTQNVRQSLDYVARGEVEAGFVYATDALLQKDRVRMAFGMPTPVAIQYPVAVVAGTRQPEMARQFAEFLGSPTAQTVLARHGFLRP